MSSAPPADEAAQHLSMLRRDQGQRIQIWRWRLHKQAINSLNP